MYIYLFALNFVSNSRWAGPAAVTWHLPLVFAVGMPDLGTIIAAAIPTDDAGGENAAATVVEAQFFPPGKLSLHQIKLLRVDDRLMALFDVVLGNLALIDLPLFVQKIHGKALLKKCRALVLFICENGGYCGGTPGSFARGRRDAIRREQFSD